MSDADKAPEWCVSLHRRSSDGRVMQADVYAWNHDYSKPGGETICTCDGETPEADAQRIADALNMADSDALRKQLQQQAQNYLSLDTQCRELQDTVESLRAEVERLRPLSLCGCGDEFTPHDPGTCGACVSAGGSFERAELERMRELRHDAMRALAAWDGTVLPKAHDGMMQERMECLRASLADIGPSGAAQD